MKKLMRYIVFGYALVFNAGIAYGANIPKWGTKRSPANTKTDIIQSVMNIANYVLGFIAMICVLMIFYGLITGANTIKYAIIGLVVCGLAYAMVIVVSTVVL